MYTGFNSSIPTGHTFYEVHAAPEGSSGQEYPIVSSEAIKQMNQERTEARNNTIRADMVVDGKIPATIGPCVKINQLMEEQFDNFPLHRETLDRIREERDLAQRHTMKSDMAVNGSIPVHLGPFGTLNISLSWAKGSRTLD